MITAVYTRFEWRRTFGEDEELEVWNMDESTRVYTSETNTTYNMFAVIALQRVRTYVTQRVKRISTGRPSPSRQETGENRLTITARHLLDRHRIHIPRRPQHLKLLPHLGLPIHPLPIHHEEPLRRDAF